MSARTAGERWTDLDKLGLDEGVLDVFAREEGDGKSDELGLVRAAEDRRVVPAATGARSVMRGATGAGEEADRIKKTWKAAMSVRMYSGSILKAMGASAGKGKLADGER